MNVTAIKSMVRFFFEKVTFWLKRAYSMPFACVFAALYECAIVEWLYVSLMRKYATYTYKAVTGRIETKT